MIQAYAALEAKKALEPFEFDPGPLGPEQVEIEVQYCGLCHSDLSMLENDWGMSAFPLVGGHEVVGKIAAVGDEVKARKAGDTVGLGWYSQSCMSCRQCLSGNHNLCPNVESTIVHRHGGFASRVRCHWAWATPLPAGIDLAKAGPLFCGGVTVFNPFVISGVRPTARVGVIGIGGLGHMALQFARHWGCEVVAFTSSDSKRDEAMKLGAHEVVNSRDAAQLQKVANSLDLIVCTANASLPWDAIIGSLAPNGRLHFVGAVLEPIPVAAFALISGQKAVSGSPLGSISTTLSMLDFCARHKIEPVIESYPMSKINDALERLKSGKARYRIVLENDFH